MRSRPLLTYFVLVFAITWGTAAVAIFAPEWFNQTFGPLDGGNPVFFVAVFAPTMLSIALTGLFEGRAGLQTLFARLDPRRFNPVWLLVVIAGFIGITAIASWAGTLTGGIRNFFTQRPRKVLAGPR